MPGSLPCRVRNQKSHYDTLPSTKSNRAVHLGRYPTNGGAILKSWPIGETKLAALRDRIVRVGPTIAVVVYLMVALCRIVDGVAGVDSLWGTIAPSGTRHF
jgi:hypothetical protein